ncbi:quinate/shikimate dehydrogenase [Brachyspira hampsonii]|nr:quinate/shikimate dehydrogenase [Brachyspira hampsonii]
MQVNAETILTGLFASPSKHSISPIMHNEGFNKLNLNYIYLAFEVDKNNLKDAVTSIRMLNMRGVNLSMPNKKEVIKYLDNISEAAELSQSVNTIVNNNGILTGYSTDGEGFIKSLEEEQVFIKNKNITILGTGGASIAIISQAALYGVKEIYVFKRDTNWNEQKKIIDNIAGKTNCSISLYSLEDKNILKSKIENSYVLINATSVGMKEDVSLIEDSSFFRNDLVVSDCIYHPAKTKLLKIAEKEG